LRFEWSKIAQKATKSEDSIPEVKYVAVISINGSNGNLVKYLPNSFYLL
jgi:hypothetical protein